MAIAAAVARRLRLQTLKPHHNTRTFSSSSVVSNNHSFLPPNPYLSSWTTNPNPNPKEAQTKLALLRRDYAKQVKEVRKEYIMEMELQRLEKLRKEQAKKEAMRLANEERKANKAETKKARAAQRALAAQEFRQTLLKERAQKLEYWKTKLEQVEEKKKKKNEDKRKQSSVWIDEAELEKKILDAIVNTITL